ncbi:MAG: carboxypeptidase regulatory-like domain-containing protein [Planctomycetota bacterium]|nr:MAG: carboxypeptidase regulatory-like domain-containing protein [Planctomycetota bacterium]
MVLPAISICRCGDRGRSPNRCSPLDREVRMEYGTRSGWGWFLAGVASVGLLCPVQLMAGEAGSRTRSREEAAAAQAGAAPAPAARQDAGRAGAVVDGAALQRPLDIALGDGKLLTGRVLTPQGTPAAGVRVALLRGDRALAVAVTDKAGVFGIRNVTPGTYHLATASNVVPCRVWAADAAPPAADGTATLVHQPRVVRGQLPVPAFIANNPGWVAAAVFAGVAIAAGTVAIVAATDDDNPPPASP